MPRTSITHECSFCEETKPSNIGGYYLGKWICDECAKLLQDKLNLSFPSGIWRACEEKGSK